MPSRHRNVSSIALSWLPQANRFWLFDCGEATQHRLWDAGLTLHRLERIYITHLHGDHIFGLPGVLGSRSAYGVETPLHVYGPSGLKRWIETTLSVSETHLGYPLEIHEVSETPLNKADGSLIDLENLHGISVQVAWLHHAIPSLGYRVEEPGLPGTVDVGKAKHLGIPAGPLLGRLKRGESVVLPSGRVIHATDVVGPPKRGRIAAILGDTRPCPASIRLAQHADVLIHEATFTADYQVNAQTFGHSTVGQAASIARDAKASQLLLTHISARYGPDDTQRLLSEAHAVFPQTVIVHDGYRLKVLRPE